MINYADLALRLRGKQVKDDALMPWVYRFANPEGRPYHEDWKISASWPWWLQPWTRIKRMDTTFLLPLPAKLVRAWGPVEPSWVPYQTGYPLSPGAQLRGEPGAQEILTYHPVLPAGQAAVFAVWLDGAWRECYYTRTEIVCGKRIHHNRGVKFDVTRGDFAWNYPEASLSIKEIK